MFKTFAVICAGLLIGTTANAEPLRVVTSASSSPFSRGTEEALPGFNHEYLMLISEHADLDLQIEYLPWKRAQKMAQEEGAELLIFNLTRTAQREPLYDWATRLITVEWAFLSTNTPINSLDDARGLSTIGARSVYKRHLEGEGFANVEEADTVNNFQKMAAGRVDAVFTNIQRARFIWVEELDFNESDLKIGAGLKRGDIWLGATPGYDAEIIAKIDQANAELRVSGAYAELYAKYFGSLPVLEADKPDQKPSLGGY